MQKLSVRNWIALVLIAVSAVLFVFGITKPIFTFTITNQIKDIIASPMVAKYLEKYENLKPLAAMVSRMFGGEVQFTRNVLQSIVDLFENKQAFIGMLLVLFCLVVPALKVLLLVFAIFANGTKIARYMHNFVNVISKWAMVEVFIVAIFIATAIAKKTPMLDAEINVGFYYFVIYCLLSIAIAQLVETKNIAIINAQKQNA